MKALPVRADERDRLAVHGENRSSSDLGTDLLGDGGKDMLALVADPRDIRHSEHKVGELGTVLGSQVGEHSAVEHDNVAARRGLSDEVRNLVDNVALHQERWLRAEHGGCA